MNNNHLLCRKCIHLIWNHTVSSPSCGKMCDGIEKFSPCPDNSPFETVEWFVVGLYGQNLTNSLLDHVYNFIEHLETNRQFDEIDYIFNFIMVDKVHLELLIGLLTATLPVKSKLNFRKQFYFKVRDRVIENNQLPDVILKGLL